ncbi:DUF4221 family protein [Pedobacter alluvionis]|uniref:DUF4221 domain-containing protein n=1 Tax=Pedobacter alluvionis TaxID=475253 RepID=A0A497XS09_9SPHI|nr:DUF4221 family protein [Pedobacter alluvionis]RLJ71916.1 uncharacterized protein DUF4221 [Pedobacter alluvionis]TFB28698.1 DUF4221 domain-containing protein [Pedobacter alluvionis]
MFKYLLFVFCLFCFICICFISCKNSDQDKYIIKSKFAEDALEYEVKLDSIHIPIKQEDVSIYFTYTQYSENNVDYLLGYSPTTSSIDVFDLTNRTVHKRLSLLSENLSFKNLDKKDLDKSRSVTDISIINFNSIILNYGNDRLIIIDTNLRKKQEISLYGISVKNNMPGRLISYSHEFKMFFYDGQLILNQVYYDFDWVKKVPAFASLNLLNGNLHFLPISYSDYLYKIKGSAGFLTSIVTSEHQKTGFLTYSYLYESNIYQYDPKNSTITSFGATPSKGKNIVDSISYINGDDPKKWVTHHIENSQFFNVMYDQYRHVYYRFSLRNIIQKDGKYFKTILDKPLVLMIFNEKFEIIKEIELPMYKYSPNTWFITKEGLFISPTHRKNKFIDPLHLRFDIIKVYKNKSS